MGKWSNDEVEQSGFTDVNGGNSPTDVENAQKSSGKRSLTAAQLQTMAARVLAGEKAEAVIAEMMSASNRNYKGLSGSLSEVRANFSAHFETAKAAIFDETLVDYQNKVVSFTEVSDSGAEVTYTAKVSRMYYDAINNTWMLAFYTDSAATPNAAKRGSKKLAYCTIVE